MASALVAELSRHGITSHRVVRGGKHHQLRFLAGGAERLYVFSSTPSDHRTCRNSVSGLRRLLRSAGGAA